MENFFTRYKNPLVLMAILFVQVVALATQVKRPEGGKGAAASGGTRLIRIWTVTAISPFERAVVGTGSFIRRNFYNYIDLHDVRKQNRALQEEIAQLKLEQVRLRQDAEQAKRLQALLGFTQHYVGQVLPAQVIGTSGTEQSHIIQIDKGSRNGVKVDMPVITPDGIVGKVKDVFPFTSQVLMINDRESGAGVILQNSRLQGILRGSPQGELHVSDIMSDEKIDVGEEVVTSGGDRIYPKGLPVGTVTHVSPDRDNDPFLAVKVKPAADLSRLEEVLVVTRIAEQVPQAGSTANVRAADILSERLPSVPKPDETKKTAPKTPTGASASPSPTPQAGASNPGPSAAEQKKTPSAALKAAGDGTKKVERQSAVSGTTPSASAAAAVQPSPKKKTASAAQTKAVTGSTAGDKTSATTAAATSNSPAGAGAPKPKPSATPAKKLKSPASPEGTGSPGQTKSTRPAQDQPPTNTETPPR
jgi:rod shape-determining protein MreC